MIRASQCVCHCNDNEQQQKVVKKSTRSVKNFGYCDQEVEFALNSQYSLSGN